MKRIALEIQLKSKVYSLKLKLLKHRVEYWYHRETEYALFACLMFGLFFMQVALYFSGR